MATITINLDPAIGKVNQIINKVRRNRKFTNNINKDNTCDDICPPKKICPPKCILKINRTAATGEQIIVPFIIKNKHSNARTYNIGARPLIDDEGQLAAQQPFIDLQQLNLHPGQSRLIRMKLDLNQFKVGHAYFTEIVIRENKFNQNICFTLYVTGMTNVPVAFPWDEQQVYPQFLSWKRHFICLDNGHNEKEDKSVD